MSNIGILDADLVWGNETRFPNLAVMKLSSWHRRLGDRVAVISDPKYVLDFDQVYVCCVFTNTAKRVPKNILQLHHVCLGGTGFYFDKAKHLPEQVEHSRPDYEAYNSWLKSLPGQANSLYYTSASIGFLTRGCFRKCSFCVNRNYSRATAASRLEEFYDPSRKRVCLLDDNFLAYKNHRVTLQHLIRRCESDGAQFEFKQGLDVRLLGPTTAQMLNTPSRFGEIIFAFDSISYAQQVRTGLKNLRKAMPNKGAKSYVLCGYESQDWRDIASIFRRMEILWSFRCLGYIMRHQDYENADPCCRRIYTPIAGWANQPQFQRTNSFRQFCEAAGGRSLRTMVQFQRTYPEVANRYFDARYYDTPQAF